MSNPTPHPYERATEAERKIGRLWWCVHHKVLLEPLTEPVENRVTFIRGNKTAREIETRLRALRPVRGRLPAPVAKADAARAKADAALAKADAAWEKALADHQPALLALFAKECPDVKWGANGLVFPVAAPQTGGAR